MELTVEQLSAMCVDITDVEHIEVKIREDGKVIWVNANDICICRVSNIKHLVVHDERPA